MRFEVTTLVKHTRVYALNMKYATMQFGLPFHMNNTYSQYRTWLNLNNNLVTEAIIMSTATTIHL